MLDVDPALDAPIPWRGIRNIIRDSQQTSDYPAETMRHDRHTRSLRHLSGNYRVRAGEAGGGHSARGGGHSEFFFAARGGGFFAGEGSAGPDQGFWLPNLCLRRSLLGAIRGEHVRAAARSIGAALIEEPMLEADHFSREGNSATSDGMRGPEIRVEWHEERCHEAPDRGS